MNKPNKQSDWVSASDVGLVAKDPKRLEAKYRGKEKISESRKKALKFGDRKHEEFNRTIKSSDSRCYIASHLYGVEDPKTEMLRQYRDRVMLPKWYGRLFVNLYYKFSPGLVKLSRRISVVDLIFRIFVNKLVGLTNAKTEEKQE